MSAVPDRLTRLACDPMYRGIAGVGTWRCEGSMRYEPGHLHVYEPGGEPWSDLKRGRQAGVFSTLPAIVYIALLGLAAMHIDGVIGVPVVLVLAGLALAASKDFGELTVTQSTAPEAEVIGRVGEVLP
jgi:hypothetical protein